jgi:hypothetical protein
VFHFFVLSFNFGLSFPCCNFYLRLPERDPFHLKGTLVHLVVAMELGHSNNLYLMPCKLVKDYPQEYGLLNIYLQLAMIIA